MSDLRISRISGVKWINNNNMSLCLYVVDGFNIIDD